MTKQLHHKSDILHFRLPENHGKLMALWRRVLEVSAISYPVVVKIKGAGIWPTWEDRKLYEKLYQNGSAPFSGPTGNSHNFDEAQKSEMFSALWLFSSFRWDFSMWDSRQDLIVKCTHDDEVFLVLSGNADSIVTSLENIVGETRFV